MPLEVVELETLANFSTPRSERDALVIIIAPNFEERSVTCCSRLVRLFGSKASRSADTPTIKWIVLTLQGANHPGALDAVKAVNTRRVITNLTEAGYGPDLVHRVIDFPIDTPQLIGEMTRLLSTVSSISDLYVDFSAIPRSMLWTLLDAVAHSGEFGGLPPVNQVRLLYAWAKRYPEAAGPELLGEPVGHFTRETVGALLSGAGGAELIVFAGGSTHDAYSVITSALASRMGNRLGVHLVNFFNKDNLHESWLQLTRHQTLINEAPHAGVQVHYCFTVRHALAYLRDVVQSCTEARERGDGPLLLIGSFGPKPLAVAAQFVAGEYQEGNTSLQADVLNSRGSQYLSTYSLGSGEITVFAFEKSALESAHTGEAGAL